MADDKKADRFDGYLFAKLSAIGTKSEGPIYLLQQNDYTELHVQKQVPPWNNDPALHKLLGRKVTLLGAYTADGIVYDSAGEQHAPMPDEQTNRLLVSLKTESNTLWVDKMPGPGKHRQRFGLTLSVQWPYRSIWKGQCPTSQLYEFRIRTHDREIWRWSAGHVFAHMVTPVTIPGGNPVLYPVFWDFAPADIHEAGEYIAEASFLASGQEAEAHFKVEFAH